MHYSFVGGIAAAIAGKKILESKAVKKDVLRVWLLF